jgi:hypothetical protein
MNSERLSLAVSMLINRQQFHYEYSGTCPIVDTEPIPNFLHFGQRSRLRSSNRFKYKSATPTGDDSSRLGENESRATWES